MDCAINHVSNREGDTPCVRGALNRWPDKSVSVIIGQDSSIQMNFEHAWGDGAAILNIENHIYDYIEAQSSNPILTKDSKGTKTKGQIPLEFNLNEDIKKEINKAYQFHEDRTATFHVYGLQTGNAPGLNQPHWFVDQEGFLTMVRPDQDSCPKLSIDR